MEINAVSQYPICDFCSESSIWAVFPANTFNYFSFLDLNCNSEGEWFACKVCAELINGEKWDDLRDRALAVFKHTYGYEDSELEILKQAVEELHSKFRENRNRIM